jgi:hypothetical protein
LLSVELTRLRLEMAAGAPCDMNDPLQVLAYNLFGAKALPVADNESKKGVQFHPEVRS